MAEIWRVVPADAAPSQPFTSRESLDNAIAYWRKTALNPYEKMGLRQVARALAQGTVQVAAEVVWVDVND